MLYLPAALLKAHIQGYCLSNLPDPACVCLFVIISSQPMPLKGQALFRTQSRGRFGRYVMYLYDVRGIPGCFTGMRRYPCDSKVREAPLHHYNTIAMLSLELRARERSFNADHFPQHLNKT